MAMFFSTQQKRILVMVAANVVLNIYQALSYASAGVIFLALVQRFPDSDSSRIGWVGAMKKTTTGVAGLLLGPLMHRFGLIKIAIGGAVVQVLANLGSAFITNLPLMIFVYGFITGIGYSCFQLVIAVSIQHHVVASRIGLANGIIMAGQGLGVVLWSPLQQYWIETYGWTKATCFEAVMMLPVFVVIYIIHLADKTESAKDKKILKDEEQYEESVQNDNVYGTFSEGEKLGLETSQNSEFFQDEKLPNTKSTSLKNSDTTRGVTKCFKQIKEIIAPLMLMRKYPAFIMYCCALFPAHIAHIAVYFILPARGIQVGETSQQAAFMVSIIGAISVVGRIAFGAISDTTYLSKRRAGLVAMSFIVNGLIALACGFLPYSWTLICYSVVFGSTSGVILQYTGCIWPVFVLVSGCMITAGSIVCAIPCCPQPPTDGHGKNTL